MIDFTWQSLGGLLLGGDGDIASTNDPMVSVKDIVRSRLKAALNGWQLYAIGADLDSYIGDSMNDPELLVTIQRGVFNCLTSGFLEPTALSVQMLAYGQTILVLVYLQQKLISQAVIALDTQQVVLQ